LLDPPTIQAKPFFIKRVDKHLRQFVSECLA
jgi:hypothetical protein